MDTDTGREDTDNPDTDNPDRVLSYSGYVW